MILRLKNKLRKMLRGYGYLDYSKPIKMALNSSWDIIRLQSCKKEPETVKWIEESLSKTSVFYDIGANVGAYALIGALKAKTIAIEPSPATFATLCENIELNRSNITPLQLLLGDTNSIQSLTLSSTESGAAEHRDSGTTLSMPMMRLDTLIETLGLPAPTHIKLDVDGGEMEVLKGIPFATVTSILIETEMSEPVEFLKQKGFVVSSQYKRKKEGSFNYILTKLT